MIMFQTEFTKGFDMMNIQFSTCFFGGCTTKTTGLVSPASPSALHIPIRAIMPIPSTLPTMMILATVMFANRFVSTGTRTKTRLSNAIGKHIESLATYFAVLFCSATPAGRIGAFECAKPLGTTFMATKQMFTIPLLGSWAIKRLITDCTDSPTVLATPSHCAVTTTKQMFFSFGKRAMEYFATGLTDNLTVSALPFIQALTRAKTALLLSVGRCDNFNAALHA